VGNGAESVETAGGDSGFLMGRMLGGCRIESEIGRGGMGVVYRAYHEALDIPVALKVLSPQFGRGDPAVVGRFIREARSAARLRHQNVVGVFNVGEEKGLHFIVQELVEGHTLGDELQRVGKLPPARALDIAIQVGQALEEAARHAIIHRDVKPDNILIGEDGMVKLADLGLAKSATQDQNLTGGGMMLGTPYFMAPEQVRSNDEVDHRSDLYSLGCTIYRLLCGVLPYQGDTVFNVLTQHVMGKIPDPRQADPDVPDDVAEIVMRLMAKDPGERYQSATELLADLRRARAGLGDDGAAPEAP